MGKMNEGTVVAVGPGARNQAGEIVPMSVSAGDKVLLPEYGGAPVKIDEDEFSLFKEHEILGKFE